MAASREWCEESQGHRHNLAGRTVHIPRFTLGQGLCHGRYLRTAHSVCWVSGWPRREEQELRREEQEPGQKLCS